MSTLSREEGTHRRAVRASWRIEEPYPEGPVAGRTRLTRDPRAPPVLLRGETINSTLSRGTLSSVENDAL